LTNLRYAIYVAIALAVSLLVREFARAFAADRLGDPTPRRWGRLTLNPRPMVDPFGTIILPLLILVLIASGAAFQPPPFAYAKPLPLDPSYLKHPDRDTTLISLAGPLANLVLAAAAGLALRVGPGGDLCLAISAALYVNIVLFVFHLMPIPGLDGARILARFLPPRARAVYTNLDQYLVLIMLVVFFIFSGPLLAIVGGLADAVATILAGSAGCSL
jgi:Zn-dependent protease